nr:RHS repeat-associated core domain-containing protein [uncultured Desulfobacter sp.]
MKYSRSVRIFKAVILALLTTALYILPVSASFDPPTDDDLAQTMECEWAMKDDPENPGNDIPDDSDELVALAESLGNDPVKIYNWVHENVYFPQFLYDNGGYYFYNHSRLGARGAYLNRIGNTWDQSSLLIALLRISGIHARYVHHSPSSSGTDIDRVYVIAWLDLDNPYGLAEGGQKGWVTLVPWMKKADLVEGKDLFPLNQDGSTTGQLDSDPDSELNFNFDQYLSKVKYESALEEYEQKLQNYLYSNDPGKSLKDIPFKEIFDKNTGSILPRSYPVNIRRTPSTDYSEVLDTNRQYIDLSIDKSSGGNLLTYRVFLPKIVGKTFYLDWKISGSTMKPVLKLDDEEVCGGEDSDPSIDAGKYFSLTFQVRGKDAKKRPDRIAGTFIQMGFDPLAASVKTVEKMKKELQSVDMSLVLDTSKHEKYLRLMGGILVDTYLTRLYENAERTADLLYSKISWGLAPTFIFTKPNSTDNPIETAPESKFYYHPQWNIDQQTYSGLRKWDKGFQIITEQNNEWNDSLNELCRRLYMFGASYDEGKIFEDWMDTPGASTIRGIMVVNEEFDKGASDNYVVTLTKDDIVEDTQPVTLNFESIPALNEYDSVESVYGSFDWANMQRIDSTNQCVGVVNGAVTGTHGVYCSSGVILRGTKFNLTSMRMTAANDEYINITFELYKEGASSAFYTASLKNLYTTPRVVTLNFPAANRINIISSSGPVIIDDLTFTRTEYIEDLDDQTEGHLGYSTILSIVSELNNGAKVVIPVQEIEYEELSGSVRIVYGAEGYGDTYAFGMYNGGSSSPNTETNETYVDTGDISLYTDILSDTTQTDWLGKYALETDETNSISTIIQKTSETINAAKTFIGDPVDMVTGEFYAEEKPDITVKSRGFDLSVIRKYRSQTIYNGPFGYGWTWNHAERIMPLTGGDVKYYNNEADAFEITSNGDGTYTYPAGSQFILTMEAGQYIITQNLTMQKSYFSDQGYLIKKEDRFGNTLLYEYADTDHPTEISKITDELGRFLAFTYNTSGKVTTVTGKTGEADTGLSCSYLYSDNETTGDGLGDDLIEFQGLDYEIDPEDGSNSATKYQYLSDQDNVYLDHNMILYTMPGGDTLEIGYYKNDQVAYHTNAKGETFNFMYSRLNRYAETWNEEGYYRKVFFNESNDVIRIANEDGTMETMVYDGHHNKTHHTDGNGYTTEFQYYPDGTSADDQDAYEKQRKLYVKTDAMGHTWRYQYDDTNNPYSVTQSKDPVDRISAFEYYTDGNLHKKIQAPGYKFSDDGQIVEGLPTDGFETAYVYDDYGNITQITDARGNSEIFAYDTDALHLLSKTDKNGHQTSFDYYPSGNTENQPPDLLKSKTVTVGGTDLTTTFEYNAVGQKTKETDPLSQTTTYEYNTDGKLVKTTLPNGAVKELKYYKARDVVAGAQIKEAIDPLSQSELFTYDAIGKLTSRTDKNGNTTSYTYDPMGRLAQTTDALGNITQYQYDGNGNKTAVTDALGHTSTYTYDAANRLIEETIPCGLEDSDTSVIRKTYTYYDDGKLESETTDITDADHEDITVFYEYDQLGHLFQKTDGYNSSDPQATAYRYDALGNLTGIINPLGDRQTFVYDGNGNKTAEQHYDTGNELLEETLFHYDERNLLTHIIDPLGDVTVLVYDAAGRKISQTQGLDTDLVETVWEYDTVGNIVKETDPLGRLTRYSYDLNRQKIKLVDAAGETSTFGYDPNGNQISTTYPDKTVTRTYYDAVNRKIGTEDELGNLQYFEYDEVSNLILHTDARGNSTTFQYDQAGRMFRTIDALGNTTETEFDETGRVLATTNARGIETQHRYDVHGNLLGTTIAPSSSEPVITEYEYDENNRRIFEIRSLKVSDTETRALKTQFVYDDRGLMTTRIEGQYTETPQSYGFEYNAGRQLVQTTDPNGNITKYFYDTLGRKIAQTQADGMIEYYWEYDVAGNVILEQMPEGELTIKGYDNLNRLILMVQGDDRKEFAYDSRGRLIREVNFNGDITQYTYDLVGRLDSRTSAAGITGEAATSTFSYDENGNLLSVLNPLENTLTYEYDVLNRKIKEADADGSFQQFTYDGNGNIETITRQDSSLVTFVYDDLDRKIEVRLGSGSVLQQQFEYDTLSRLKLAEDFNQGAATHLVIFSYDDFDRLETELQDSAYLVTSQYDNNGNKETLSYPSGKTVQKNYDGNNNLSAVYDGVDQIARLEYDRNRQLIFGVYGNNTTLSVEYDNRGREMYRAYSTPGTNELFRVDKSYDGQSNVATRNTEFKGTFLTEAFGYDHHDRLTGQYRNSVGYAAWQYDLNGNWKYTDQNGLSEPRTVTSDNEYNTIDSTVVSYDDRGNMTFDGTNDYTYDWANRLTQVSSDGAVLASYTYDALNRRVTRTVGTVVTTFVYDSQSVIEEYTASSLERIFIYADTLDDPVLVEVNGQDYYYLKDSQHSVKAILDAGAALVESYNYNPFGLMMISDDQGTDITTTGSTIGNPFGYTGRRWDNDSGLWYYRNRMYSASLGRFMQRDPAGYVDGLNLYTYVLNNPLRYTDPDGLMARDAWDSIDPTLASIKGGISDYLADRGLENYEQGYYVAAAIDSVGLAIVEGAPENKVELAVEGVLTLAGLKAAKYLDSLNDVSKYIDDVIDVFNFKGPAGRHTLTSVNQKTVAKNLNTVIEPGVDVASDVAAINKGLAQKIGDKFVVKGRTYGMHDGTLYPVSGAGFHQLDRAAFKALGVLNKFGNTSKANQIINNMGLSDDAVKAALKAWGASQ